VKAIFLSGDEVYLRAMLEEDKNHAMAWVGVPYPVNAHRAEELLKERHKQFWPNPRYYAICRTATDEIVGGTKLGLRLRSMFVTFQTAPWLSDADEVQSAALRLMLPWLRDEWDMMVVTVQFPSDLPVLRGTAEELGMLHTGTFREYFARPGGRADALIYEALNPRGEIRDA
jgi:RimJ/RimL family protein N-acetyltransferase